MKKLTYLVTLTAVVPLLAFGPGERTAPAHWALVIGITDYIHFDDVEGGDLPAAERDARSFRDALVGAWGFPEENVQLLLNREATREGIERGVRGWLTRNARPGDHVTVYFAGHGSQMWDEDGDEDDGLDETLAPADVLPGSTENDISDDDFGAWLRELPTDNVVVVLDNCNSGTGTRAATPFSRSRQLGRDVQGLERPTTLARRALPGQEDETGFDAGGSRVLELAAAQPHQQAVEAYFPGAEGSEPFQGGAFTTYLVRQLWRAPSDATYEDVFRSVHEALKRNRFQQDPHLSEDVPLKSRALFFVEGGPTPAAAGLPVRSVAGGEATIAGGQALGVTPGSVLGTEGGAVLVVRGSSADESTARVVSGSVSAGDRVRLTGYRYPPTPLRVNVAGLDGASVSALRTATVDDPAIVLVEDADDFSHLLVRRSANELRVVGSDGFVRHGGIAAGASGADALAAVLTKEAAAMRLGEMENPAPPFEVSLQLRDGRTTFGVGQEISFHVTSGRDGYLTLVDAGNDGTVAVLLPNADVPSIRLRAGQRIDFPAADAGITLQALPPAGRGLVRAFVTEEPVDIDIPEGEVYASGGPELARAVAEAVRRAAGTVEGAIRLDTWGTAAVVYDIRN